MDFDDPLGAGQVLAQERIDFADLRQQSPGLLGETFAAGVMLPLQLVDACVRCVRWTCLLSYGRSGAGKTLTPLTTEQLARLEVALTRVGFRQSDRYVDADQRVGR